MFKGGYQGVDFTGYTLSETPVTISGLYNLLTTCGKPIIVSGIDGLLPSFVSGAHFESDTLVIPLFIGIADDGVSQYSIAVTNEDAVTLVEASYAAE